MKTCCLKAAHYKYQLYMQKDLKKISSFHIKIRSKSININKTDN